MNENALKPVLLILTILLPNSLPAVGLKGEFVHEGNKSCGGSCSKSVLASQELPCYGIVVLRPLVYLFPSMGREQEATVGTRRERGIVQ